MQQAEMLASKFRNMLSMTPSPIAGIVLKRFQANPINSHDSPHATKSMVETGMVIMIRR